MSSRSKFFILFFLAFSFSCLSQEKKQLRGRIIAGSLDGSSINIVNLTGKIGTTNNSEGKFEIAVAEGDSLFFSSVQYEPLEILVTEEVIEKAFLEVYLTAKVNELAEVTISNTGLSGNLGQDLANIKTVEQSEFGFALPREARPTSIERKLKTSSGIQKDKKGQEPALVTVSLDGILNRLNRKIEMLQKAQENEELSKYVDQGIKAVPVFYFVEHLQIPEEQIINFVHFCAENPNFPQLLPDSKRFELMDYYRKKAAEFIAERMEK